MSQELEQLYRDFLQKNPTDKLATEAFRRAIVLEKENSNLKARVAELEEIIRMAIDSLDNNFYILPARLEAKMAIALK